MSHHSHEDADDMEVECMHDMIKRGLDDEVPRHVHPVSEDEGEASCPGSVVSTSPSQPLVVGWTLSTHNHNNHNNNDISVCEKKRVSWDRIHIREFALIVGDHPFCQDGLPVSLDWHHADNTEPGKKITCLEPLSERRTSYTFPKRLSYEERRERICSVSGLTDDQVKNDEIDLVVRTLQEAWESGCEDVVTPLRVVVDDDPTPMSDDRRDMDITMMNVWDDLISQHVDVDLDDLGDMSDFEWTD
jgi:hypothetical protein